MVDLHEQLVLTSNKIETVDKVTLSSRWSKIDISKSPNINHYMYILIPQKKRYIVDIWNYFYSKHEPLTYVVRNVILGV